MQTDASEERLSKYELQRLLGSGGMGEVYLARDTVLRRQVAIKFVSPQRLGDPSANARLLREARAAATLDHPGICPVYDVQVDANGRTCIVMQYVDGETLAARLARGAMAPAEAVALGAAIADALAAAHARGIVHRDLKPQNIVLGEAGRPKLLDFGIAQADVTAGIAAEIATHTDTAAWSPGAIVGTPAYTSPEQVLRKPVDARSDLFSLGAVLFESLTGQPAFLAGSDIETWARVVYVNPPPPSSFNPRIPAALDAVVARLLAKAPEDRYQSAADAAAAIRAVQRGAVPQHRRSRLAIAAVFAVATTVGASAWWFSRPAIVAPPAQAIDWYQIGTRHLRNGAYYSARAALHEAVKSYDPYLQAWAELAEAQAELDDSRAALTSLVRVADLAKTTTVSADDAARVAAMSAFVLRDLGRATAEYQRFAEAHPSDPGAWLDLGRVREAAESRAEAQAAYERALAVQPQYAAAHLRLGVIAAAELRRDEALRQFGEAERLYVSASDYEGQTETLLQRAAFLNAINDLSGARKDVSAAAALAASQKNPFQQIRAQLTLGSVTASEGSYSEAAALADAAATAATRYDLATLAAEALIQSGTARLQARDRDVVGAQLHLERGIDAAKAQGAHRLAARGTLQLASVFLIRHQPQDALNVVEGVRPFLHDGHYRRLELLALSIESRAYEALGRYATARALAADVLKAAEDLKDDAEVALAVDQFSALAAASGALPDALQLRVRAEALTRARHNVTQLPFDLTLHAELLIRLGRFAEADTVLAELEAGIDQRVDAYVARQRKTVQLRALADTEQHRFQEAERRSGLVVDASREADTTSRLAAVLLANARGQLKRPPDARDRFSDDNSGSLAFVTELRYWRALALLSRGRAPAALAEVTSALAALEQAPSPEAAWRLEAVGAAAAGRSGDPARAGQFAGRAGAALARLRADWKGDAVAYEARPDLIDLRRMAGLS